MDPPNLEGLSVDEERKDARLTFPRQLRLSVEHEKRLSAKDTEHVAELRKLLRDLQDIANDRR